MDRIEDVNTEELDSLVAAQMAEANSAMWGDWDLNEKIDEEGYPTENPTGLYVDRRTRPNVSYYFDTPTGRWLPSRLKANDHVQMLGAFVGVVAMASRDRRFFLIYAPDIYGPLLVPLDAAGVTDRAPLDPEEEAMPINAPPPAPEPPPEGTVTITTTLASHDHAATITTTIDDEGIHTEVDGAS